MKKMKYLATFSLSLAILSGCTLFFNKTGENDEFSNLNIALTKDYSHYDVKVSSSKDDLSLLSTYSINKNGNAYEIKYSEQKYNLIDPNLDVEDEMITTTSGTRLESNTQFNLAKLKINKDLISSYKFEKNKFTGVFNNGKDYLNTTFNCNNLIISIIYSSSIQEVDIDYTLDDLTKCNIKYLNIR